MNLSGTSGIRGTVGDDVTADLALSLGRALPSLEASSVVIGRDPRITGEFLVDAVAAGARECGVDVVDVGLAATPTVARAVAWTGADVGVVVTASHNPPSDNGFKLWRPSGRSLSRDECEPVIAATEEERFELRPWDETGDRTSTDVAGRHLSAITDEIGDLDSLHVAVDVGNGAGQLTVDALELLGSTVTPVNPCPDGRFPNRSSEPTAESCTELCSVVAGTDSFDALVDTVETYPLHRESVEVDARRERMESIRSAVQAEYPERSSTKDGVYVAFDDGWFLIRPSGTEPLIRITAEAKSKDCANFHFRQANKYVRQATHS